MCGETARGSGVRAVHRGPIWAAVFVRATSICWNTLMAPRPSDVGALEAESPTWGELLIAPSRAPVAERNGMAIR
eukprot:8110807-Alexandrium_andersonii.AAC.1